MITYYSYNNGTAWAIRISGPKCTWTTENYNCVAEASRVGNNWRSREEAEAWVEAYLRR